MTDAPPATIGLGPLRTTPPGLPDANIHPPTIGEAGDPFTSLRVINLLARLERGRPQRLSDIRRHPDFEGWPSAHPDCAACGAW